MSSKVEKYYNYIVDDLFEVNDINPTPDGRSIFISGETTKRELDSSRGMIFNYNELGAAFLDNHIMGKNIIEKYGARESDLEPICDLFKKRIREKYM
jgi:hypothetical protein